MNSDEQSATREQLQRAISHLESQRSTLGNDVVDAALAPLKEKLAAQDEPAPEAVLSGERRTVTVLFCDTVGSTALAETMDPETWTEIMNRVFERLTEAVTEVEGTVARLMGDGLLAFFGAPLAHEDDPRRAVLAGLAMLDNMHALRAQLQSEAGIDFNVRVGINTGLAVVGTVGSSVAAEYTVMGDAVNVAARMEQTAKPGTVQITQETYLRVAPLFDVEPLGKIVVKGKRRPVSAYRVLHRKAQAGSLRGLGTLHIQSPLVGRNRELSSAEAMLARLMAGQGGLVFILGEAGIGKSRLLREMRKSAAAIGGGEAGAPRWLEGHMLSYGRTISNWPFQEILRSCAAISEEDDPDLAWRKLEAVHEELLGDKTAEVLPYLANMLALDIPEMYSERVDFLDAEAMRRQLYRASHLFFSRLAEQRPLVLVFDDLHWIDASSAGLLGHLLPLVRQVPLLICGLTRPDSTSPAAHLRDLAAAEYGDVYTQIDLKPLTEDDSVLLLHNMLDVDGLPQDIGSMIVQNADGNPFYLEEIVRNLVETGALVHDPASGRWQATSSAQIVVVPDTIEGLVMARVDRLDSDLKRVLRRAAVIGRTFLYRVLSAVLPDDTGLENKLAELGSVELIHELRRQPELEYIFRHALAQEAVYKSILLHERRELHARVGEAIEKLMVRRLDEFYGLLAYHFAAAEQWDKAQDYLLKAGDQAGRLAADAEALSYYRQAMDAYSRVRGDDWDPLDRARLERKMGQALVRLGEHRQGIPYLRRSLALLDRPLPETRWGVRMALAGALLKQAAHRLLPALFVRPMAGLYDAEVEEILLAYDTLNWVYTLVDNERTLLLSLRALNTSESRGYAYGSAESAAYLGTVADFIGQFALAERYYRVAQEYAGQIQPPRPVLGLEVGLGTHYNGLAELQEMVEQSRQGRKIAASTGDLRAWGVCSTYLALGTYLQGDFKAARGVSHEILRVADDSSDRQLACWGLLALGCVQLISGQVGKAVVSLQEATEIAEALPDYVIMLSAWGWLGRSYLALGDVEKALQILEHGGRIASDNAGNLWGYVYLGNGLSEAYLTLAESAEGSARQQWLHKAREVCGRSLKEARSVRLGLPQAQMFQGRCEWLLGRRQAAQEWWARALAGAERTNYRVDMAMVHLEIGRYLHDRQHLETAAAMFAEMGAAHYLAQARQAIQSTA